MLPLSSHVFFSHNKQVIELCTSRANQNLCTGGLDFRTWKLEMCKIQISVIWLKQFLTPSFNKSSIWGVAVNNKNKTKRRAGKSLNSTFQVTLVLTLTWFLLSTFNTTTYHLLESLLRRCRVTTFANFSSQANHIQKSRHNLMLLSWLAFIIIKWAGLIIEGCAHTEEAKFVG